ncbi:hypothetical protein [Nostoc sp.]
MAKEVGLKETHFKFSFFSCIDCEAIALGRSHFATTSILFTL